jgi:Putative Flp pilus-assembly TadE/G-like
VPKKTGKDSRRTRPPRCWAARLHRDESGVIAIIVAIVMVLLLSVAALVVDLGLIYHTKRELQTAADAAALAGAWELPRVSTAKSVAVTYAGFNDVEASETAPITPYDDDPTQIEVVCTRTVPLVFARVMEHSASVVTARAVAQVTQWTGSSLPFINLDEPDYLTDPTLHVWGKVSPGDFESIQKSEYDIVNPDNPATLYFDVHWEDGLELKKGNVATVKQEVGYIFDRHENVYMLSLRADVISSGRVKLTDGSYQPLTKLKNGDDVDPSQLVLLECTFDAFDANGNEPALQLTVLKVFDIGNGVFPPARVSLIE